MVASKIRQHRIARLGQRLRNLWLDDRGQSTTEYILILAVVVMIAMKFKSVLNTNMGSMLQTLGNNLNSAVQDTSSTGN